MKYIRYVEDCKRIQQILLDNGYEANLAECQALWEKHSEDWCAGWLILYGLPDVEIWKYLKPIVEEQV